MSQVETRHRKKTDQASESSKLVNNKPHKWKEKNLKLYQGDCSWMEDQKEELIEFKLLFFVCFDAANDWHRIPTTVTKKTMSFIFFLLLFSSLSSTNTSRIDDDGT